MPKHGFYHVYIYMLGWRGRSTRAKDILMLKFLVERDLLIHLFLASGIHFQNEMGFI